MSDYPPPQQQADTPLASEERPEAQEAHNGEDVAAAAVQPESNDATESSQPPLVVEGAAPPAEQNSQEGGEVAPPPPPADSVTAAEPTTENIEDLLESVRWVAGIIDPAAHLDALHEAFETIIFRCVERDDGEDDEDAEDAGRHFKTAAERKKERKRKAELRAAQQDLQDTNYRDDDDENGSVLNMDEEDEDDDDDDGGAEADEHAKEFLNWIYDDGVDAEAASDTDDDLGGRQEAAVELELQRVGLGSDMRAYEEDPMPERLHYIELLENRKQLGPKPLPQGLTYHLPVGHEAFWILRQLRLPGQPLAHNAYVGMLASKTIAEVSEEPIVQAIAYAIEKMTHDHLEPGHLMIHHQTNLAPLLAAMWENSAYERRAESLLANPSYAYSIQTGRRQRPYVTPNYVGFSLLATRLTASGDPLWTVGGDEDGNEADGGDGPTRKRDVDRNGFTLRKPCFIELGRLLVRILQLDILCHRLEHRRQQLLLSLVDSAETRVQQQRELLSSVAFEDLADADFWWSYVRFLNGRTTRGPTNRIKALRLEEVFEEYTITGAQYNQNLHANAPIHTCPPQQTSVYTWASQVGAQLQPPRSSDYILNLFNKAIVEQFSLAPVLMKRVFDLFCAEGDLIVTYLRVDKAQEVCPLVSLFAEYPKHYLDLVDMEKRGDVSLDYLLDDALVRGVLNTSQLYDIVVPDSLTGEEWSQHRRDAIDMLIVQLFKTLVPKVQAALLHTADLYVQNECMERLGSLCEDGPYSPTRLFLDAYTEDRLTWDSTWNCVEALPKETAVGGEACIGFQPRSIGSRARICSAYRAESGVTCFCFTDESGAVIGMTRWADCALNSDIGRAANMRQTLNLERLFRNCCPTVIAIGASSMASLRLLRTMQQFVRERIHTACMAHIPIVWAPVEVSRQCSFTTFINEEMPNSDTIMRTAISLARYVRDPMLEVCALFDTRRTVLNLSLGIPPGVTREQKDHLYRLLHWEMSLWVCACGVEVGEVMRAAHPVATLQFIGGFGPGKAAKLYHLLKEAPMTSRTELRESLISNFGETVARNATTALRVAPSRNAANDATLWHPLDQTLIPLEWYGAAELVASLCVGPQCPKPLALMEFSKMQPMAQRDMAVRCANAPDVLNLILDKNREEWASITGVREVDFIIDELLAMGQSTMRRPYRRITAQQLMLLITGIVYLSRHEAQLNEAQAAEALSISEGDYITGSIVSVRAASAFPGVQLTTSRGLSAFLAADDITDAAMRQQFLDYVDALQNHRNNAASRDSYGTERVAPPDWLRRGAIIQGTVVQCNWERCELRLRWCHPRPIDVLKRANERSSAELLFDARQLEGASSANSVRTATLEKEARVFATKLSRHSLFRDVSNVRALEILQGSNFGELLLRPTSRRPNEAACVVKIGEHSFSSWLVSEERRSTGALYYAMTDRVTDRRHEFDEMDEFLSSFVEPMLQLVESIRKHRRFVHGSSNVRGYLDEQQRINAQTLAYAFVETGKNELPPYYRIHSRAGRTERRYKLHIDNTAIYVKVPILSDANGRNRMDGSRDQKARWVHCNNAEQVSQLVKKLANGATV